MTDTIFLSLQFIQVLCIKLKRLIGVAINKINKTIQHIKQITQNFLNYLNSDCLFLPLILEIVISLRIKATGISPI